VHVTPPSGQTSPFVVSLDASSCPLPHDVTHARDDVWWSDRRRRLFFFPSFLSPAK